MSSKLKKEKLKQYDPVRWITDLRPFNSELPVHIVASGPSLRGCAMLEFNRYQTIAVNDAALDFSPDIHLFWDRQLFPRYRKIHYLGRTQVVISEELVGEFAQKNQFWRALYRFIPETEHKKIREMSEKHLWIKSTILTGAIHLAARLGACAINLWGVDGYYLSDGHEHYHNRLLSKHQLKEQTQENERGRIIPKKLTQWNRDCSHFAAWLRREYSGVDILNMNPNSKIKAWRKIDGPEKDGDRSGQREEPA